MIDTLPPDTFLLFSTFLSVRELLVLRLVCRRLASLASLRPVWYCALSDIVSSMPLPGLQHSMLPKLSTFELCVKAVSLHNLHQRRMQQPLIPRTRRVYTCRKPVRLVKFLPGGEWILLALHDGCIQLHTRFSLEAAPSASVEGYIHPVDHSLCPRTETSVKMNLYYGSRETFAVEHFRQEGSKRFELRVLAVRTNPPALRIVTQKTLCRPIKYSCAAPGLLCYGQLCHGLREGKLQEYVTFVGELGGSKRSVAIRLKNIFNKRLVPQIGAAAFLSRNRLLLCGRKEAFIIQIPELQPPRDGGVPVYISVIPEKHFQWEETGSWTPLVSPVLWDSDLPMGEPVVIQAGAALRIIHHPLDTLRCTIETCKLNERWDSVKYPEMRACHLSLQSTMTMDECDDTFRMATFVASPRSEFGLRRLGCERGPRLTYTGWFFDEGFVDHEKYGVEQFDYDAESGRFVFLCWEEVEVEDFNDLVNRFGGMGLGMDVDPNMGAVSDDGARLEGYRLCVVDV